jgi:GNAT superfamily N-acetyltransferase
MRNAIHVKVTSHEECRIDPDSIVALYAAEQWWPGRTHSQLADVLESGPAVAAWKGERLVGFARAVTDGVFRAYVEDVVVAADARHAGVGKLLVTRLLELLPPTAVTSLFCRSDLSDFYTEHGFHPTNQLVMHRQPPN